MFLRQVLRTTPGHLKKLKNLGIETVEDFLSYFPRTYKDYSKLVKIIDLRTDEILSVKGKISNLYLKKSKRGLYLLRALLSDETGSVEVLWFNQPHIQRILKNDDTVILSGKLHFELGKITLQNPIYELAQEETIHTARIVPHYHETEGLTSKWIREKIKPLLDRFAKDLRDYLPSEIKRKYLLMDYGKAVREVHFPTSEMFLNKARYRLAFDELFLIQLKALQKKLGYARLYYNKEKSIPIHKEALKKTLKSLPFELTNAQKRTLKEILIDLKKPYPMSRLVQGDVGSGKTVVAGLAMLNVIKNGFQTALMAPTEILAKQHFNTLSKLFFPHGANIQFIAGSTPEKQKETILQQMKTGTVDVVIGTHALIQENIQFNKLGFAVIDEQHRFGVKQRETLKKHGSPHVLNLSATPIPRTLALTLYGDQDLSIIDELPKGRQIIITRIVPGNKRNDAYRWVEDQVLKGRQVFIICPLIEDPNDTDSQRVTPAEGVPFEWWIHPRMGRAVRQDPLNEEYKSVLKEYERLKNDVFPDLNVGFLHGKLKSAEKEAIMNNFQQNKINILVSTSVVEVGIDVPNATIMIIEGAERFGLAQLHQFRGRVGRGQHQSYCFLFMNSNSEDAKTRLNAMVKYASGFKLAEIDLLTRGPGEIYGIRQSGIPDLKMASLSDSKTISLARQAAEEIVEDDLDLITYKELKEKLKEIEEVHID